MDYNINSVNFFEDLKNTNIKMEDWKEIISSYKQLEADYIKNNQADLLRDLNKQKKVILSYLSSCQNASIKKLASMTSELEKEFGNLDEIDTFETPSKNINFIKIAYKNGKWAVSAKNLSEDLEIKDIPTGINNLVSLVDRLDEQEAAYALNHAKTAGKFVLAALPYVRTDMPDTAWTTRYMKEPTVPLGPYEKSEDSVSTHNMPVSRQFASEGDEILLGDKIETVDGDIYEVVAVSDNQIITSTNETIDKMLAEGKLESGEWMKVEAAKDEKKNIKITRIEQRLEKLAEPLKNKYLEDEAISRLTQEYEANLREIAKYQNNEELEATLEPQLRKLMAKIDTIKEEDGKLVNNYKRLVQKVGSFDISYSRPAELERVVNRQKLDEVVKMMEELVAPRNLSKFQELEKELITKIERSEQFAISLSQKDPKNEELIQDEMEKLRKQIKTSQNPEFERDAAYNELDELLINGDISFKQYSDFTDLADVNAKEVIASVKFIKANLKEVEAGIFDNIIDKLKELYNSTKEWFANILPFLSLQEKEVKDTNEELNSILED